MKFKSNSLSVKNNVEIVDKEYAMMAGLALMAAATEDRAVM